MERKKFLKEDVGLTGMEVSLNKMPAGSGMPFHYEHQENEELYFFIRGKGQFQLDGETIDVSEGTAIRVALSVARCWRNNFKEDFYYLVIQAKANSLKATTGSDGVALVRQGALVITQPLYFYRQTTWLYAVMRRKAICPLRTSL